MERAAAPSSVPDAAPLSAPVDADLPGSFRLQLHTWRLPVTQQKLKAAELDSLREFVYSALGAAECLLVQHPQRGHEVAAAAALLIRNVRLSYGNAAPAMLAQAAWYCMRRRNEFPLAVLHVLPALVRSGKLPGPRLYSLLSALWNAPDSLSKELRGEMLIAACRVLSPTAMPARAARVSREIVQHLSARRSASLSEVEGFARFATDALAGGLAPEKLGVPASPFLKRAHHALIKMLDDFNDAPGTAMLDGLRLGWVALSGQAAGRAPEFVDKLLEFSNGTREHGNQGAVELPPARGPRRNVLRRLDGVPAAQARFSALLDCIPRCLPGHVVAPDDRELCLQAAADVLYPLLQNGAAAGGKARTHLRRENEIFFRPLYVMTYARLLESGAGARSGLLIPATMRALNRLSLSGRELAAFNAVFCTAPVAVAAALTADEHATYPLGRLAEPLLYCLGRSETAALMNGLAFSYICAVKSLAGFYSYLRQSAAVGSGPRLSWMAAAFSEQFADAVMRKISDLYINSTYALYAFSVACDRRRTQYQQSSPFMQEAVAWATDEAGVFDHVSVNPETGSSQRCPGIDHFAFAVQSAFEHVAFLLEELSCTEKKGLVCTSAHDNCGHSSYRLTRSSPVESRFRDQMRDANELTPAPDAAIKILFRPKATPSDDPRIQFELVLDKQTRSAWGLAQNRINRKGHRQLEVGFRLAVDLDSHYRQDPRFHAPLACLDFGRNYDEDTARSGELLGNILTLNCPHGNHDPEAFSPQFSDPAVFADVVEWLHRVVVGAGRSSKP